MNKYLFLDIYNGESYSDSYAKLIKSKKISVLKAYECMNDRLFKSNIVIMKI